jgi:hypothetical protein
VQNPGYHNLNMPYELAGATDGKHCSVIVAALLQGLWHSSSEDTRSHSAYFSIRES